MIITKKDIKISKKFILYKFYNAIVKNLDEDNFLVVAAVGNLKYIPDGDVNPMVKVSTDYGNFTFPIREDDYFRDYFWINTQFFPNNQL